MAVSFLENKTMQTIRARVAFHSRQHGFDKCMQQILNPELSMSGSRIAELYAFWGDPLSPSDESFIRSCMAEAGNVTGPIVQCGASLLTIVLGALCTRAEEPSRQIWCLEHDRHWANVIRSWLTEYRVSAAHVIHSPARVFDDYVWYGVDTGRLGKQYQLVICDGARATPQGVIGAIHRLESRLDDQYTILGRNVKETPVLRLLNEWAKTRGAKFALIDKQEGFIKLSHRTVAQADKPTTPVKRAAPVRPAATAKANPPRPRSAAS
jgi:hypothetical protein